MKQFENNDMCQFRLNLENQLWCRNEDGKLSVCGRCQSCVCRNKLYNTTQWLSGAGGASKLRFFIGIFVRCNSVDILENTQKIVQVTLGKDFTYTRSRQKPRVLDDLTTWSSYRTIDWKPLGTDVPEMWDWFSDSKYWVKANYILGLLSLCSAELLHALGNLIGVLIEKERRAFLQFDTESHYAFGPEDHPELDLLFHVGPSFPMPDLPCDFRDPDSAKIPPESHQNSAPSIDLCLLKKAPCAGLEKLSYGGVEERKGGSTGPWAPEDPATTVVPGSSVSLSGVGRHRDFIRRLPVHLAKRILGLLDRATLLSCLSVSQHWHFLTEEVQAETLTKRMVENQAMIMQGSSTVCVSTAYSKVREVLVPIPEDQKGVISEVRRDRGFESAYAGLRTRAVEMEERNVFCGAYNILVLSNREDSARVVHFSGGQLVAVGSRDRLVRLLDVKAMRERPLVMQGHAGSIRAVHLCEDRGLVVSAGYDLSIRCWNLKTGSCTMLLRGHFGTINCLDLHGNTLVSGAKDCRVKVWDLLTGKCYQRLRFRHDSPVQCVRAGLGLVLSGCDRGLLKLWDIDTGRLLKLIDTPQGSVKCLYLDQWHALSGGTNGCVTAWSTRCDHAQSLMTYRHPREVLTLTFVFLRVVTGCADGKIRVFDFLSGDCLRVIMSNSQQSAVLSLHIHGNNIVINTSTSVLLFQFGRDNGGHSEPSEGERMDRVARDSPRGSGFRGYPYSPDRAQSAAQMGSSSRKMYHSNPKQGERDLNSQHAHSLSTPSMQQAKGVLQGSLRPTTGSLLQGHHHSWTHGDQQLDSHTKPRLPLCPGRAASRGQQRPRTTASTCSSVRDSILPVKWGFSRCEVAARGRTTQRGARCSATSKPTPLDLNVSQQPQRCNLSNCSIHLEVGVRDGWGSPVPPLWKQPATNASLPATPKPATPGPRFTPSSVVKHPQTGQGFRRLEAGTDQPRVPYGMGLGKTVHRVGAFTTTAKRDIPLERALMSAPCRHSPNRSVSFNTPPGAGAEPSLFDPFRRCSLFQLLTGSQLEEREQAVLRQHEEARFKERGRGEKQRRTAWRMRAKGLSSI